MADGNNLPQTNKVGLSRQTPSTSKQPVLVLRPQHQKRETSPTPAELKDKTRKEMNKRLSLLRQEYRIASVTTRLNKLREDAAELEDFANAMKFDLWLPFDMPLSLLLKVYSIQLAVVRKGVENHAEEANSVSELFSATEIEGLETKAGADAWLERFEAIATPQRKCEWRKVEKLTAAFFKAYDGLIEVYRILENSIVAANRVIGFVGVDEFEVEEDDDEEVETEAAWRHRHPNGITYW